MAKDEAIIFLVDDDELYLLRLKDHLQEKLYFKTKIYTFTSGETCLENLTLNPDIIVLDYYFSPEDLGEGGPKLMNGIELIRQLKEQRPDIHLIMLSCETDVEVANTAIKEGAKDYIIKYEYAPIQLQYLINNIVLNRIFSHKVNYWKWGAMVIGAVLIFIIIYLIAGGKLDS
ncbi:MAG: response regulator transcription factor [Bacteroidia bacterium]